MNLEFSLRGLKNLQISSLWYSVQRERSCSMRKDRRTQRNDEANIRFSQLCELAYKIFKKLICMHVKHCLLFIMQVSGSILITKKKIVRFWFLLVGTINNTMFRGVTPSTLRSHSHTAGDFIMSKQISCYKINVGRRDFRLPPHCRSGLHFPVFLHSLWRWLFTDISEQRIGSRRTAWALKIRCPETSVNN